VPSCSSAVCAESAVRPHSTPWTVSFVLQNVYLLCSNDSEWVACGFEAVVQCRRHQPFGISSVGVIRECVVGGGVHFAVEPHPGETAEDGAD